MNKLPDQFIKTARICGIEHLAQSKGHFYVEQNKILSASLPEGVDSEARETVDGVVAEVVIRKGVKIKEPLFFCWGITGAKDKQYVVPNITLEEGAEVTLVAHCSFPNAEESSHKMDALHKVGKNAVFNYEEHHYHGSKSGAYVVPKLRIEIAEGGEYNSSFSLAKGTVGDVEIEVEAILQKDAKIEIESKVMGRNEKDKIKILDIVRLEGENSRSLIKMRAAARDGGQVLMQGETYANAPGAFGHVDCQEIVSGKGSVARAVPIVEVNDENARVTHEASVGKINQKELETLMTRGLDEDEATDLIIDAMMR